MPQFGDGEPVLSRRFADAVAFAVQAHTTQQRKGTQIPYTAHLLGVAAIALENGADEDQAIAAMLHDAVEDADVTIAQVGEEFGPRVEQMLSDCTDTNGDKPPPGASPEQKLAEWQARKRAYIASLARKSADSLLVSISDKTHNARTIVDDLVAGDDVFSRFTGGRKGTLQYYRALANAFHQLLPGRAAQRYEAAVREMERLATGS